MSAEFAACLKGARAFLQLNVKSVARALRMSDKTLTDLEKDATEGESKAEVLAQFYEDLGLLFTMEGNRRVGVVLTTNARRVVISAKEYTDPPATVERLCKAMRHVGGLAYNLRTYDKTKSSVSDTMECHFPITTRTMVREILCRWFEEDEESGEKATLIVVQPNGEEIELNRENVAGFL